MYAVIRIPLSKDSHPDVGIPLEGKEPLRSRLAQHVQDLLDNDALEFTVDGKKKAVPLNKRKARK